MPMMSRPAVMATLPPPVAQAGVLISPLLTVVDWECRYGEAG